MRLVIERAPLAPLFIVSAVSPVQSPPSVHIRNGTAAILISVDISTPRDRNGWICLPVRLLRPLSDADPKCSSPLPRTHFHDVLQFDSVAFHGSHEKCSHNKERASLSAMPAINRPNERPALSPNLPLKSIASGDPGREGERGGERERERERERLPAWSGSERWRRTGHGQTS